MTTVRVLVFGDVIGAIGRQGLARVLPELKATYAPILTVANIENLAHGSGITEKTVRELYDAGVDAFTGGNHSWGNPLGLSLFTHPEWSKRIIAPMNFGRAGEGQSSIVIERGGVRFLIANVIGQLFMHPDTRSPFGEADTILAAHTEDPLITLVDIHAEATAEKEALANYLDGRVSAVVGTHTHVATGDARILPGGTAYVTDLGRCGAHDSVVGFDKNGAIQRFLTQNKVPQELPTTGAVEVNGLVIDIDTDTRKAIALDRIRKIVDV